MSSQWRSQSHGRELEASIESQAALLDMALVRQFPASRFAGGGSKAQGPRFVLTGKAWPDYFAFLPGYPPLAFDAKFSQAVGAFSLPKDREHQFESLRGLARRVVCAF